MKRILNLLTITFALLSQLFFAQESQTNEGYCIVKSARFNNYITNVQFANINNYSDLGTNGYSDFTEHKANIDSGKQYTIKVDTKWNHWSYNSIQVWIDWNADANFDDSERVFNKIGSGSISGIVSVPENTRIGVTRMRVRYNYYEELGPCESKRNVRGETEDYLIEVEHPKRPRSIFDASSTHVYSNREFVRFADRSMNNPTSWRWEFEGGIPSVSTDQNPLVRYVQSGSYSVKLIVENEYGSNEITYVGYIKVNIRAHVNPPGSTPTAITEVTDTGMGRKSAAAQNVVVTPNPSTNGIFTFAFKEVKENISFKVFNDSGLEVSSLNSFSGTRAILSLPNLQPGLYTVQVTTSNSADTVRLAIQ